MVGQHTRAGSHFIKFWRESWCCRGASPAVRPCRALPKWRAGEGAMSTLFIVSAAALSTMAGSLRWGRGLSLPYEHEDRGADVRNQEKADERGGERETEFEREQFGCISVAVPCHGLQSPSLCRNRLPSESSRDRVASWMSGECARPHTPVDGAC